MKDVFGDECYYFTKLSWRCTRRRELVKLLTMLLQPWGETEEGAKRGH